MNSQQWLNYYQSNRVDRPEPKWNSPSPLDRDVQQILGRSLSHFQLGETGEGKVLITGAKRQVSDDSCYIEALRMFVAEEGEHARLLDRLVRRFGAEIIKRHWTRSSAWFDGRWASSLKFNCWSSPNLSGRPIIGSYSCEQGTPFSMKLRVSGSCRGEFFREARAECIRFLRQLQENCARKVKQFAPVSAGSEAIATD
jgi:hypothetical protein